MVVGGGRFSVCVGGQAVLAGGGGAHLVADGVEAELEVRERMEAQRLGIGHATCNTQRATCTPRSIQDATCKAHTRYSRGAMLRELWQSRNCDSSRSHGRTRAKD